MMCLPFPLTKQGLRAELLRNTMSLIGMSYKIGGQSIDTGMIYSGFIRHVDIYLSANRFIYASCRKFKRVMVSDMGVS